jgi:hypothetical protein
MLWKGKQILLFLKKKKQKDFKFLKAAGPRSVIGQLAPAKDPVCFYIDVKISERRLGGASSPNYSNNAWALT